MRRRGLRVELTIISASKHGRNVTLHTKELGPVLMYASVFFHSGLAELIADNGWPFQIDAEIHADEVAAWDVL